MKGFPPFSNTSTSFAAALSVEHLTGRLRLLVYSALKKRQHGATCDELEQALGLRHQTCSARINELWKRNYIKDSGVQRPTRTGRKAIVWVVT